MTFQVKYGLAVAAAAATGVLLARRAHAASSSRLTGQFLPVKPLRNGNLVVVDEQGEYVACEGMNGEALDDKDCAGVLDEMPDVDVPITAQIRMTVGRLL